MNAAKQVDTPVAVPAVLDQSRTSITLGRFRLMALIGKGGMGKVYRAEDIQLKRQVALKVLPLKLIQGQHTYRLEQFIREARSAAVLEHPHVVHIYEMGAAQGWCYIAMELMEGGNLGELMKAGGPLEAVQACQLLAEAAEALAVAHKLGIVHRDIKPANLMLTRSGRCKVTDFGLVRMDDPADPFRLPFETVGTPLYAAPEICLRQRATPASDIYSLGATLFYLLAGAPPFTGQGRSEIIKKHQDEAVPNLRKLRPELPEDLAKAVETALAKKPEDRFSSADQFARVLRRHTIPVGLPGAASGSQLWSPGGSGPLAGAWTAPNKIHWGYWLAGGAGVLSLMLSGVLFWRFQFSPEPSASLMTPAAPTFTGLNIGVAAAPTADHRLAGAGVDRPVVSPPLAQPVPATPAATPAPTTAVLVRTPPPVSPASEVALATDLSRLQTLAERQAEIIVEGKVAAAGKSATGKIVRIHFQGNDTFYVGYFEKLYAPMADRFGPDAKSLVGKKVRVRGQLKIYKGTPNLILDSVDQIETLP